jgi:hypothetical protein
MSIADLPMSSSSKVSLRYVLLTPELTTRSPCLPECPTPQVLMVAWERSMTSIDQD